MGVVYRARDPRLGRDVAIKLISDTVATDASRMQRFEQEARAAGQLNHPNIVAVFDVGRHASAPYIVSELLEGESLRSRLLGGALPPRRAIDYARQIAEGLAAAHERNIVHRDVKPDNLFITKDGRIKILDFGIAKLTRPSDDSARHTGFPTETEAGLVVGTASYMSPEQVRGEAVDPRSDIFSCGAVFYEMLAGRPAFTRDTAPETMTAILKDDPPALRAPDVPPSLARIVSRCLEKTREMRFQSARDLAFGLEMVSDTAATAMPAVAPAPQRWRAALAPVMVAASLLIAGASWLLRGGLTPSIDDLLARATFTPFSNFDGSELDAAVSPDGRFVAFLSDRDGPYHLWLKQIGTGAFQDLTPDAADQRDQGPNRSVGFSADGSEIWGHGGNRLRLRPLTGGPARAFLTDNAVNVAWSPDGSQLVYFVFAPGDPMFIADRTGGNARQILISDPGDHNHFPVWSQDGKWIYYTHAIQAVYEFDIWRIPAAGGTPEQLTNESSDKRYVTPIDANTVLFVAPGPDRTGPWLWALDVKRRAAHRVSVGLERYLSVAASADGRRLVAAVANQTATLWSVPILDRLVEERDVSPYRTPTGRALAPRFGTDSLFFLSSSGPGDGLWRLQNDKAVEIWKGSDEPLVESPAVSPLGDRLTVVLKRNGKLQSDSRVRRWRRPSFVRSGDQCPWHVGLVPGWEMDRHRRQRCPGRRTLQGSGGRRRSRSPREGLGRQPRLVTGRKPDHLRRAADRVCTAAGGASRWQSGDASRHSGSIRRRRSLPLSSERQGARLPAGAERRSQFLAARSGLDEKPSALAALEPGDYQHLRHHAGRESDRVRPRCGRTPISA